MSYTVRITSTKPANVAWYSDTSPAAAAAVTRFETGARSAQGFVNLQKTRPDTNTIVKVYEFDTKANYDAFIASTNTNADDAARKNYNNQNSITTAYAVV